MAVPAHAISYSTKELLIFEVKKVAQIDLCSSLMALSNF